MMTKLNNKIIITTCVQLSSFSGMLPPPKYISKLNGVAAQAGGGRVGGGGGVKIKSELTLMRCYLAIPPSAAKGIEVYR